MSGAQEDGVVNDWESFNEQQDLYADPDDDGSYAFIGCNFVESQSISANIPTDPVLYDVSSTLIAENVDVDVENNTKRERSSQVILMHVPKDIGKDSTMQLSVTASIELEAQKRVRHLRSVQKALYRNFGANAPAPCHFQLQRAKMKSSLDAAFKLSLSSSLIVVDPTGNAKSLLVDDVLREYSQKENERCGVALVNGLLIDQDSDALRDITDQLINRGKSSTAAHVSSLVDLETHFRHCKINNKPAVIVLEEFHVFASHKRQTLIYTLLDLMHNKELLFIMIGITSRADAQYLMEKRVMSRLNAQYVYMSHASAEDIARDLYARLLLPVEGEAGNETNNHEGGSAASIGSSSHTASSSSSSSSIIKDSATIDGAFRARFNRHIVSIFGEYANSSKYTSYSPPPPPPIPAVSAINDVSADISKGGYADAACEMRDVNIGDSAPTTSDSLMTTGSEDPVPTVDEDEEQLLSQSSSAMEVAAHSDYDFTLSASTPLPAEGTQRSNSSGCSSNDSKRSNKRKTFLGRCEVPASAEVLAALSQEGSGSPKRVSRSNIAQITPVRQPSAMLKTTNSSSKTNSPVKAVSNGNGHLAPQPAEPVATVRTAETDSDSDDMPIMQLMRVTRGGGPPSPSANHRKTSSGSRRSTRNTNSNNDCRDKAKSKRSSRGRTASNGKSEDEEEYKSDGDENEEDILRAQMVPLEPLVKAGSLLRVIQTHREWGQGIEFFTRAAKKAINCLTVESPYITVQTFKTAIREMEPISVAEQMVAMPQVELVLLAALTYLHLHDFTADYFTVAQLVIVFNHVTGNKTTKTFAKMRVVEGVYYLAKAHFLELYNHQTGHMKVTDFGTDYISNQTLVFMKADLGDVKDAFLNKSQKRMEAQKHLCVRREQPIVQIYGQIVRLLRNPLLSSVYEGINNDIETVIQSAKL